MANGKIISNNTILSDIRSSNIYFKPSADLVTGARGYYSIPVPSAVKNASKILSTSIIYGHPAGASGLQYSGAYISGDNIYVTYYAPIGISKDQADVNIKIWYIP